MVINKTIREEDDVTLSLEPTPPKRIFSPAAASISSSSWITPATAAGSGEEVPQRRHSSWLTSPQSPAAAAATAVGRASSSASTFSSTAAGSVEKAMRERARGGARRSRGSRSRRGSGRLRWKARAPMEETGGIRASIFLLRYNQPMFLLVSTQMRNGGHLPGRSFPESSQTSDKGRKQMDGITAVDS